MNLGPGVAHGRLTPTQPTPQLAASCFLYGGGSATSGGGGCSFSGRSELRWPSTAFGAYAIRAAAIGGGSTATAAGAKGSFYELLEIPESGSLEEIKRAYKQMARRYHPDVSPPDRAVEHTQRFIAVQEAYETLSDPFRRALYDRDLAKGLHLAFSTRRRFDEELEEKPSWRNRWQDQLAELKRRRTCKDSEEYVYLGELVCAEEVLNHLPSSMIWHKMTCCLHFLQEHDLHDLSCGSSELHNLHIRLSIVIDLPCWLYLLSKMENLCSIF